MKKIRTREAVECANVFLSAENNPEVLRNSPKHANSLFIIYIVVLKLIFSMAKSQSDCANLIMNSLMTISATKVRQFNSLNIEFKTVPFNAVIITFGNEKCDPKMKKVAKNGQGLHLKDLTTT